MVKKVLVKVLYLRRAPYGARGLKSVWVRSMYMFRFRRAPYGARGLKFELVADLVHVAKGRAPYGARGLKYTACKSNYGSSLVAPRMGRVD